jgi:hypothetical protein
VLTLAVLMMLPAAAQAQSARWRLNETAGTVAADSVGTAHGAYVGNPGLGARGALSFDADPSVRFDGIDDEMYAAAPATGTLEGWFFWEAGVALMRDSTSGGGWILAFDSAGRVAYRVAGTTFVTPLATADVRDGWHHVVVTVDGGQTAFYLDGTLVHGAPAVVTAPAMPWHVMRNGTTAQYTRGRADDVAVYAVALTADAVLALFRAGRDVTDTAAPATPGGLMATARLGRVELDWGDVADADLDGYDVFRSSGGGPFTRVSGRLSGSAYVDTSVTGGTAYSYAVTASDEANNRSPLSAQAAATPPSTADLLRTYSPVLRYEAQETYFADSAAEMTDNYVAGSRQNVLVSGSGTRLAAANPADPLADLSLAYLGDPTYADGRAASSSHYLDAANTYYQQDAQRMRAAGYGDRVYGRAVTQAGKTWLQYWLFSYYNPQNVFGFGVHEGDWEFVQVGLGGDGAPDVATYAQHSGGERCAWSAVQKSGGAPVVYVALASHASYFSAGVNPRGFYPDDYHRGSGYQVRPALEIFPPFMAWRGRWGASSSSPASPRQQGKWGDPGGFNAGASACTVGAAQAAATQTALRASAEMEAPRITATRDGAVALVRYAVDARPSTLVVSVAEAGAPEVATARRVRVTGAGGAVQLRLPPASPGPHVVSASAFSERGARSPITRVRLR